MLLRNHTPFSPLFFIAQVPDGQPSGIVVLRATFQLEGTLPLHQVQEKIIEADIYHGLPLAESSLIIESDLAPYKPKSDILFNAVAHAPEQRRMPAWDVGIRVGKIEKRLRVCGPRAWRRRERTDWVLDEPEPALMVPLRYERAFGGTWASNTPRAVPFEPNPVGCGFVPEGATVETDSVPAPQIESPDQPIKVFQRVYAPEGVGPLARAWQPRRTLAGTFDATWQANRWPDVPEDFDFAFYNCAHPSLTYPEYLRGDEQLDLTGLHSSGNLAFRLSGYCPCVLVRYENGTLSPRIMLLDTLFVIWLSSVFLRPGVSAFVRTIAFEY